MAGMETDRELRARPLVLIVDDHPVARAGCVDLLLSVLDLEILEADDADTAFRVHLEQQPDLLVLDVHLGAGSGIDLLVRIRQRDPDARLLVLSMDDDVDLAVRAMKLGALGYLSKLGPPDSLVSATREVLQGRPYLDAALARELVLRTYNLRDTGEVVSLTPREQQVFELMGRGCTQQQIVAMTGQSARTVSRIYARLKSHFNVDSVTRLVQLAVRQHDG